MHWCLDHHAQEPSLRLTTALSRFWLNKGHLGEGRIFVERVLATYRGEEHASLAQAYLTLGAMAQKQGDIESVAALLTKGLTIARQLDDRYDEAEALRLLGSRALFLRELDDAHSLLEESLHIFRQIAHIEGIGRSLYLLANCCLTQGE